jgi:hypothetical protein
MTDIDGIKPLLMLLLFLPPQFPWWLRVAVVVVRHASCGGIVAGCKTRKEVTREPS